MKILHVSTECYPAAKAGGLGDVVGALPKYLNNMKAEATVIIPKYGTKWINTNKWKSVFKGTFNLYHQEISFDIESLENSKKLLGFQLYVANIPGKFDRSGVYLDPETNVGYGDEVERALCFQQATLKWVISLGDKQPDIIHCHDHHTGLIPFMMKHSYEYNSLHMIPSIFTIHNGEYHGDFRWERMYVLPYIDVDKRGLLDWGGVINPLACGIKCCWSLTTVSPGYLEELQIYSRGLESLLRDEAGKSQGILNGIDTEVWDPKKDKFLHKKLAKNIATFKKENKKKLLEKFDVNGKYPLITFIGRLAGEKGAQLLPNTISNYIESGGKASFIVLGTGDPHLHEAFSRMKEKYKGIFDVALEYNEGLAHQLYAGSDFLIMPSKVEPCGLNQMYALRYGTLPIVRSVGGLKDTIIDISNKKEGVGIRFDYFDTYNTYQAIERAVVLYDDKKTFETVRDRALTKDFSWEQSAQTYLNLYKTLK